MKLARIVACALLFIWSIVSPGLDAGEKASADIGRTLFSDPALGTSGRTCNNCHPGGKGLEKAGVRKDLARMVNTCIAGPLKGKSLSDDSVEMRSIILYIKSLGDKSR